MSGPDLGAGPNSGARVPYLPRGVRLHDDRVRGVPVLLGPERALMLDAIGHVILSEVDGHRSLAEIAAELAARFGAPADQVAADVAEFLDDMAEKHLIWYRA
ncbi:pyrroloquinoline quinone biosynthesis peptide chaperone PqqD [Thioclava sp. BHET1]|nr:pyrroloquinoline quinone biosynthesis peptide chaperone PqqD [Thioclava sp. BHET1]